MILTFRTFFIYFNIRRKVTKQSSNENPKKWSKIIAKSKLRVRTSNSNQQKLCWKKLASQKANHKRVSVSNAHSPTFRIKLKPNNATTPNAQTQTPSTSTITLKQVLTYTTNETRDASHAPRASTPTERIATTSQTNWHQCESTSTTTPNWIFTSPK